jgi:hypothetical protein
MCPRGEIGRHKGLKTLGIHKTHCLRQSQVVSKHYQFSFNYLALQLILEIEGN